MDEDEDDDDGHDDMDGRQKSDDEIKVIKCPV